MPTISAFYGILIRMFFNDHPPPHFHARYNKFEATIEIAILNILEGALPVRFEAGAGMGDDALRGIVGQLASALGKSDPVVPG